MIEGSQRNVYFPFGLYCFEGTVIKCCQVVIILFTCITVQSILNRYALHV